MDVDVVPVLYDGQPDNLGCLIVKGHRRRVTMSVSHHIDFIRAPKGPSPSDFARVVRLLKWSSNARTTTSGKRSSRGAFAGTEIKDQQLHMLVELTGHVDGERQYGHTYSDLTLRLIPSAVLEALPDSPLAAARVAELIAHNPPTVPFGHRGRRCKAGRL